MEEVRKLANTITESDVGSEWGSVRTTLHMFLKKHHTREHAPEENGWEAWRIINNFCDPRSPGEEVLLEGKVLEMQTQEGQSTQGDPRTIG